MIVLNYVLIVLSLALFIYSGDTNTITTIFGTCKGGNTMNLIAIQYIMEQLIEQTCSDNLRLYRNERVCCIETDDGETFFGIYK